MYVCSPVVDMKQKARLDQELKEINVVIEQFSEELSLCTQADQTIQQELASIRSEKVGTLSDWLISSG